MNGASVFLLPPCSSPSASYSIVASEQALTDSPTPGAGHQRSHRWSFIFNESTFFTAHSRFESSLNLINGDRKCTKEDIVLYAPDGDCFHRSPRSDIDSALDLVVVRKGELVVVGFGNDGHQTMDTRGSSLCSAGANLLADFATSSSQRNSGAKKF